MLYFCRDRNSNRYFFATENDIKWYGMAGWVCEPISKREGREERGDSGGVDRASRAARAVEEAFKDEAVVDGGG